MRSRRMWNHDVVSVQSLTSKDGWRGRVLMTAVIALVLTCTGCRDKEPPAHLELADGNVFETKDWQGHWIYINYWTTGCKECAEDVAAMNRFAEANARDTVVLGVNADKATDVKLLKQINEMRVNYAVVTNDIQKAFKHSVPEVFPSTVVLDPAGKVVKTLYGAQTFESLMKAKTGG